MSHEKFVEGDDADPVLPAKSYSEPGAFLAVEKIRREVKFTWGFFFFEGRLAWGLKYSGVGLKYSGLYSDLMTPMLRTN